jgi:hypothetical protein
MSLFTEYLIFSKTLTPCMRVFSAVLVIYFFTLLLGDFIGLWVSNVIPSMTGAHLGAISGGFNGFVWVILLERNLRNRALSHSSAIRAVRYRIQHVRTSTKCAVRSFRRARADAGWFMDSPGRSGVRFGHERATDLFHPAAISESTVSSPVTPAL